MPLRHVAVSGRITSALLYCLSSRTGIVPTKLGTLKTLIHYKCLATRSTTFKRRLYLTHLPRLHSTKMFAFSVLTALVLAATGANAHATFQYLGVNGVDQGTKCVRQPQSNSPITSPTGNVRTPIIYLKSCNSQFLDHRLQRQRRHPGCERLRCQGEPSRVLGETRGH
jgi:hypothetical protein